MSGVATHDNNELCQYLEWDSAFFGRRIARLKVHRLDREIRHRVLSWCQAHGIECLYFLADADDQNTIRLAEDHGFRLTDIRITLVRRLETRPPCETGVGGNVRRACPQDLDLLRSIARTNHRQSRFYYDPHFPDASCDALYETWIEKSCHGYADQVFVAVDEGMPAGYIACRLPDLDTGQIELFGIAEQSRGKGLGRELIGHAMRWFACEGTDVVKVVTQGRNWGAQRFYQSNGFATCSVQLWYHWWARL
jgi:dTDP-4-amino-4,6-dideoxy-D-galactose acyltransferase